MRLRQAFLWSMVASLGLDAVLGIGAMLLPSRGPIAELLGSAGLIAGFSLAALLCAIVLERRRLVPLMWAGIGCAASALVPWLALVWFGARLRWQVDEHIVRIGGSFTITAIIIAQCGLVSLPRMDDRWARGVRHGTLAVSALLGAYTLSLIWFFEAIDNFVDDEHLLRTLGVMTILSLCGTVITPIIWKVQALRRGERVESVPASANVGVTCPRCGLQQQLPAGRGACGSCGLRIAVEIEEPRCPCGYLLHGPPGDRCPECGREPGSRERPAGTGGVSRRHVRVALAGAAAPVVLLLLLTASSASMIRAALVQPAIGYPPPVPPVSQQTVALNSMILAHAWNNGTGGAAGPAPRHAIELALGDQYRYAFSGGSPFCDPRTGTTAATIPLGDGTLDSFSRLGRTDQVRVVGRVLDAMPPGVVAHRLGDYIFPDLGTVAPAQNPKLWTVLMLADPDINGPPDPEDPVFIASAGHTVIEIELRDLPERLLEQNRLRATVGLAPLPDLTGVTHARPAVATDAGAAVR